MNYPVQLRHVKERRLENNTSKGFSVEVATGKSYFQKPYFKKQS